METAFKWTIQRYCLRECQVTKFFYCDNCGHYFCSGHCEWEEQLDLDGFWTGKSYPIHEACT